MNIPKIYFEAYRGNEPYIFVSYAHKDSEIVYPIIKDLHEMGYNIWYDEGIDPGNEWPDDIAKALKKCSYFLVFISNNSVSSKNVLNEINFALDDNKPFLAIHIEETILPPGLQLRIGSTQAIMKYRMDIEPFYNKVVKVFDAKKLSDIEIDVDSVIAGYSKTASGIKNKISILKQSSKVKPIVYLTIILIIFCSIGSITYIYYANVKKSNNGGIVENVGTSPNVAASNANGSSNLELKTTKTNQPTTEFPDEGLEINVNGEKKYYYSYSYGSSDDYIICFFGHKQNYNDFKKNGTNVDFFTLSRDVLEFSMLSKVNNLKVCKGLDDYKPGDTFILSDDQNKESNIYEVSYTTDSDPNSTPTNQRDYYKDLAGTNSNNYSFFDFTMKIVSYDKNSSILCGTIDGKINISGGLSIKFTDGKFRIKTNDPEPTK